MVQVGEQLGDLEIIAQLKSGGMATLYLGRRKGASGFSKHVVLKVVHPHLAQDPHFVRMFVDEAHLSARIHHPNVVHIEELREIGGQNVLVMEYVHGCSLAQLLHELARRKRRLTPELAVHIASRICNGLHAAHELKDQEGNLLSVVHRDVSPQNVLLAYDGFVKLIDFGVAKASRRLQETTSTSLKGKVRYMAPEQVEGREVDRRTDIYALGIVLWEMLTMRRLFRAENNVAALVKKVINPKVDPPSAIMPGVPKALDAVVMKALSADPEKRHPSAQAFRRHLGEVMPNGLMLDESHLAELLQTAMAEQIRGAKSLVPPEAQAVPEISKHAPDDVMRNMTISTSEVLLAGADDSAPRLPESWLRKTVRDSVSSRWAWVVASAVVVGSLAVFAFARPEPEARATRRSEEPTVVSDATPGPSLDRELSPAPSSPSKSAAPSREPKTLTSKTSDLTRVSDLTRASDLDASADAGVEAKPRLSSKRAVRKITRPRRIRKSVKKRTPSKRAKPATGNSTGSSELPLADEFIY